MKRLFIAVDVGLSDEFRTLTQQLQHDLRNDDIVWVKSKLQHLTLRFLGETPEEKIESLVNILSFITTTTPSFTLQLDKMGVFGSKYSPEVLWYGFSEFSLFKNMFDNLEKQLHDIGFQENYGNFVPHITIGRIKNVFGKLLKNGNPVFRKPYLFSNLNSFKVNSLTKDLFIKHFLNLN